MTYCVCVCVCLVTQSCLTLCDPWTVARQASLSIGILQARILEWVVCPPPGDLPNPGIQPAHLLSPALPGMFFTSSSTQEAPYIYVCVCVCVYTQYVNPSPGGSDGKESSCNAEDLGLIPGLGRSPGVGHGNPLQYSCLENPWTEEHDGL